MANVKKLSVATVYGKIKLSELMAAPDKRMLVMTAWGMAIGVAAGLSAFGEWHALKGDFKAQAPVNKDGKQDPALRASTLFVPDVALDQIRVALSLNENKGVQFAIKIFVRYVADNEGHKSGGSPYEYEFESVLPMAENDPLALIEAQMAKLALPAPAPVDAAAAVTPNAPDAPDAPDAPVNAPAKNGGRKKG